MDCSPLGSSVHGDPPGKNTGVPSSWTSSQPRDRTQISHIAGRFFTIRATREAHIQSQKCIIQKSKELFKVLYRLSFPNVSLCFTSGGHNAKQLLLIAFNKYSQRKGFSYWAIFQSVKPCKWSLTGNHESEVKSLGRVQLFASPWTVAYQAPPSMGFSRQEYWSELPFPSPGDLPYPGIEPWSPAFQADTLTSKPPGKW